MVARHFMKSLRSFVGTISGTPLAPFPASPEFRFGVASADHQCEAYVAATEDIRDCYERERALEPRGRATDFWHRFREDAHLAQGLGCTAFRLSLAWSRLEPEPGVWDHAAFAHYRDVLTALRKAGLEPFVTLHHNTWPIHIEQSGGMLSPDFPRRFAAYAAEVATRLGDLITYYVTINEPNQLTFGFIKPWWSTTYPMPPGLAPGANTTTQIGKVAQLIPNLFRANARAYDAIHRIHRDAGNAKPMIGANPLLFGFPAWLQQIVDRNATAIGREEDLAKQGRRLTERRLVESGVADVTIAQLTATAARADDVLFSETYFVTNIGILIHASAKSLAGSRSWRATVAAAAGTAAVSAVARAYPSARILEVDGVAAGLAELLAGKADAVAGDQALLEPHANDDFLFEPISANPQAYAVAIAPGNRDLSRAVDEAVRAFKATSVDAGTSPWQESVKRHFKNSVDAPHPYGRRTTAYAETNGAPEVTIKGVPPPFKANQLVAVQQRRVLRVAVRSGAPGLCMRDGTGAYLGLEPDLARFIAKRICGDETAVRFVEVDARNRISAVRSRFLQRIDALLRIVAAFTTILTTNWWYLGMQGRLAAILCPPDCIGKFDYVGLDYYWGISRTTWTQLARFVSASEQRYRQAPVWPQVLRQMLDLHAKMFPGKPLFVIENGSVESADNIARGEYIRRHVYEVQRARNDGVPVAGYLCWSITSNREWGLTFDADSDFGLYHIDLDGDPHLTRQPTSASLLYEHIAKERSAAALR